MEDQYQIMEDQSTPELETQLHQSASNGEAQSSTLNEPFSSEDLFRSIESWHQEGQIWCKGEEVSTKVAMKRKTNSHTYETKLKIIEEIEGGRSRAAVCKEYGIPSSTLSELIKHKDEVRHTLKTSFINPKRKRMRLSKYGNLEEGLHKWYLQMTKDKQIHISGPEILEQAKKIAAQMKIHFAPTSGWFQRFKARRGIRTGTAAKPKNETIGASTSSITSRNIDSNYICERDDVENTSNTTQGTTKFSSHLAETWTSSIVPEILKRYNPKDIFTAGETGLFFRCVPEKIPVYVNEDCSSGKFAKTRLTVLVATNMLGTEKLPLVAIGKHTAPRCFRSIKTIPTEYMANAKSWMIAPFFEQWVRKVDSIMLEEGRNIVLFVSPSKAHPQVSDLAMVSIIYLPPETRFQPACQGILQALKQNYRRSIIQRRLHYAVVNGPNDFEDSDISLLDALHWLRSAWKDVKPKSIFESFRNAQFSVSNYEDLVSTDQPTSSTIEPFQLECDIMSQSNTQIVMDAEYNRMFEELSQKIVLDPFITADMYATLDDKVVTEGELTEEELKDALENYKEDEEEEDDEEEKEIVVPPPTAAEAKECLVKLGRFFATEKGTEDFFDDISFLYQQVRDLQEQDANRQSESEIIDLFSSKKGTGKRKISQNKRPKPASQPALLNPEYSFRYL